MTILRDDPAVEPLSEVCWKRIESKVFAELDREASAVEARPARVGGLDGWRRWQPALALAAAAAVALVLWQMQGASGDNRDGRGGRGGDEPAAVEPSRIVTADSAARMTVGRAALTVAPRSALWVRGDSGVEVILEEGEVECAVAPQPDRPRFVVQAGDVRVEVKGTRFVVARYDAFTRVEVKKGVVEVFHDGERTELGAGRSWSSRPARPADEATGNRAPASRPEDRARRSGQGAGAHDSRQDKPAPGKGRQVQPGEAQALYERAARLEARDPDAALALYGRLAELGGPWGANALFARARLELELGHRERARALLHTYLRRFAGGANAADARDLLEHIE